MLTEKLNELDRQSSQQRFDYLLEQAIQQQTVWILAGEEGSVLLNCDGEQCVPVWPHQEAAERFINGEWADCRIVSISLIDWQARWTKGLRGDGYLVAAFPNQQDEALVLRSLMTN
ncbi:MAG: DUF2750 domain-containing protein [Reinekea sp.]